MGNFRFSTKIHEIFRGLVFCAYLFQYTCCFAQTWEKIHFSLHSRTTVKLHFGTCINIFLSFLKEVWLVILDFFFMNQFATGPWVSYWGYLKFVKKFAEIFATWCVYCWCQTTPAIYYRWQRWLSLVQNFHWFHGTSINLSSVTMIPVIINHW